MEVIGASSYPIYLYHPLFIAAVFFATGAQVAPSTSVLFVLASVAGIVGPMLMERGARQIPGGQLLLEGRGAPPVIRKDDSPRLDGAGKLDGDGRIGPAVPRASSAAVATT
jgi:hypothetical protein